MGNSCLPTADCFVRQLKFVGQLALRPALGAAFGGDKRSNFCSIHRKTLLHCFALIIKKHADFGNLCFIELRKISVCMILTYSDLFSFFPNSNCLKPSPWTSLDWSMMMKQPGSMAWTACSISYSCLLEQAQSTTSFGWPP